MKSLKLLSICFFLLFEIFVIDTQAQFNLKEKIKEKATERANQKVDQGIDKGLDAVENGVNNSTKQKEQGSENDEKSENANSDSNQSNSGAADKQPLTLKSATKYDFVPGDKVILFEDFSQDEIGDFPALWTTSGSGEVRTLNLFPGKWLYMNAADRVYCLMKDLVLPDNFIFEFDVVPTPAEDNGDNVSFYFSLFNNTGEFMNDGLYPEGMGGVHITCSNSGWNIISYNDKAGEGHNGDSNLAPIEPNKINHVIVWVQKLRLRIYHKGQKVVDLPTVLYPGIKYNRLRFSNWSGIGLPYITNLRFTTAKPDIRSKLLTEGKIVSYGIYFDVNKDKVKAESYGTLKEIAQVLNENPTVKIKIVGHTDSDGDAAKNLDLSRRRAASVKSELVANFGIDVSRIETDGKGATMPVAGNDTPANKAQNRRVEFIKL